MTLFFRASVGLIAALLTPLLAAQSKTYTNGENNAAAVDTTGNITLTVGDSEFAIQSGVISGPGSLTKTGAGTLQIPGTNNNAYAGGTIISAGTVSLISAPSFDPLSSLGSGSILVSNGAILSSVASRTIFNQAVTIQGAGSALQDNYHGSGELNFGFKASGSLSVTNGGSVVNSDGFIKFGTEAGNELSQATVTLSGAGSNISAGIDIQLGSSLPFASASSITVSDHATINAGKEIRINTNGTLSLSSGAIATVAKATNFGVINLDAGGTLRTGSSVISTNNDSGTGTINFAGGTLQANEINFTTDNLATLASGVTNTLDANGVNITWNGVISGDGGFTKTGTGTLSLTGVNTYTGDIAIAAGTLRLATDHATQTYAGAISGAGALVKAGSSSLTLSGANTHTGTTAVDAGTLVFADRGAYSGGTLDATTAAQLTVANGATAGFGVGGSGYFSESDLGTLLTHATFASGAFLGLDTSNASGGTFTLSGNLNDTNGGTNALGLQKLGAGNLTLTGTNTYTGGTVVNAGTLTLGNGSALGSPTANLTLNGGTLDLGTFSPTVGTAIFNGGTFTNGHLNNAAAFEVRSGSLAADLGGSAALTKSGGGTFTLSGNNTYGGDTTVSAGILSFAHRAAYYGGTLDATTAGQLTVASGATAAFGVGTAGAFTTGDIGTVLAHASFASGASLGVDTSNASGGSFTWNDPAVGAVGLNKVGTGTLILPGTSTYTSATTVSAGTLQIGDGGATGLATSGIGISNGATLAFNHSNDFAYAGAITGAGAVTKSGTGAITLSNYSAATGDLTVSAGTLSTSRSTFDGAVTVSGSGASLVLSSSSNTINGSLTISDGATLNRTSTAGFGSLFIGSSSSSVATVTVTGAGSSLTSGNRLYLGNSSTHPGTLNITDGGVVSLNHSTADSYIGWGGVGVVNLSGTGSALNVVADLIVGHQHGAPASTVTISDGATLTTRSLTLADLERASGTLNLNAGGTLIASDANGTAISSGPGIATFNFAGGTLKSNGTHSLTVSSNATLAAGTTSTFDTNGQAGTWSGILSGTGALTKAGAGTLTLSAANTYTGATIITAGTLRLGEALPFASTSITIASGANLDVDADSGFTLGSTQTLGGSGSITGGTLTLSSGAILAPGNSPGTLTFTNGLTLDAGAILNFELGAVSDLIAVTGGTLTGPASGTVTVNLTDAGGFAANTYILFDFSGAALGDFSAVDFSLGTTITGYDYAFNLTGSTLELVATVSAIPEPSTYAMIFGLSVLGFAMWRKRRASRTVNDLAAC